MPWRSRFEQTGAPAYPRYHIINQSQEGYGGGGAGTQPWCWAGWWPSIPATPAPSLRTPWESCFRYHPSAASVPAALLETVGQPTERLRLPPLSMYFPICSERLVGAESGPRDGQGALPVDSDLQSTTCSESPNESEVIEHPVTVTSATSAPCSSEPMPIVRSRPAAKSKARFEHSRRNIRNCCHCGESHSPNWYLMEHDRNRRLCNACGKYWKRTGVQRPAHLIQCRRQTPRRRGRAPATVIVSRPPVTAGRCHRKVEAIAVVGSPLTPLSADDVAMSLLESKTEGRKSAARPLLPSFDAAAQEAPLLQPPD
ncbi:hypothetical protein F1559_002173 [Cyanidiococcus yangmingshanensis]|uniref:GATA-type domain-containing protein n=1 Tax=Cyanidiococcus yangmingshanensis TaxID=2690220 RepID=A0A7J7IM91_9RHOD|nr:hypothetical protein F1559_002173 [Cyanidiococcus yangmingshanensis]